MTVTNRLHFSIIMQSKHVADFWETAV